MYKSIKTFIYLILFIFIVLMITIFNTQKSIVENKKEQEFINKQLKKQEEYQKNRYARQVNEQNTNYNTNRNTNHYNIESNFSQQITQNKNDNQQQINNYQIQDVQNTTEAQADTQNHSQKTKYELVNSETKKLYNIVTNFVVEGRNFAIVAKKAEYQSQYSKLINKKYYIYKYKDSNLCEAAYIIDMAIPKDTDGEGESKLFTINIDESGTVEIKMNMLSNTTRKYSKQMLLSAPCNKNKMFQIEAKTQNETNTDAE